MAASSHFKSPLNSPQMISAISTSHRPRTITERVTILGPTRPRNERKLSNIFFDIYRQTHLILIKVLNQRE
jgi:hypothetical protein